MDLLSPLTWSYKTAVRLWAWCYTTGIVETTHLKVPVFSVGNLTMGGTGKTPTTIALAKILQQENCRVSVLLRGYGGRHRKGPLLVSDGSRILATARDAGDEALVIARNLPQALVTTAKNRGKAGAWVEERFKVDVHLLDDGFQHLRLHRDLNLLVIDTTDPFGRGLPPLGCRREPLTAMRRADAVIMTRVELGQDYRTLIRQVRTHLPNAPFFKVRQRLDSCWQLHNRTVLPLQALRGSPFLAFAGIGKPAQFFRLLQEGGQEPRRCVSFPDHHNYGVKDSNRLRQEALECGVTRLVTTEKDAEKLDAAAFVPLEVVVVRVAFEFEDLEELARLIRSTLATAAR